MEQILKENRISAMKKIIYIISLFICIMSCSRNNNCNNLEQALLLSGNNRKSLESVLNHYKNDSLKYLAACFLIENMPYHYSLEEYFLSPDGEKYRPDICRFNDSRDLKKHCDSLKRCGYIEKREIIYDILSIDSTFLIHNIDLAFKVWEKPWAKNISFDKFCELILPYRSQKEKITSMREVFMEKFMPILDSSKIEAPLEACFLINKQLKSVIRYKETGLPFYPTIEESYYSGFAQCDGMCNLGIQIMRSVGIPVTVDFTIWPKMDLGHSWCAVYNGDKYYSFGPGEDQPNIHAKLFSKIRHRRPAKVYRYRFSPIYYEKNNSLQDYQTFLNSPLWYDVTDDYLDQTTDFNVRIIDEKQNFKEGEKVYLCTYNYYEWKPLAIGKYLGKGICSFKNVVGDNVFIVAKGIGRNELQYITSPFYVNKIGKLYPFIPDLGNRITFTFTKEYDTTPTLYYWDITKQSFISIPYYSQTDSTITYSQIPMNSLLWLLQPNKKLNQRVFFIQEDSIRKY